MGRFDGKVVLITGAGRGKGRLLAEAFAGQGASVAVNDITPVNLDDLVSRGDGRIRAYPEDVAKKIAVQTVIEQVEDDFGGIDILINHAAVEPHSELLDMDEWDWHRVLDVNLTGAFLTLQSVGRLMRVRGSGVMINIISSVEGEVRGLAAYSAGVYGLIALTRLAARELSSFGIRVHAVGAGLQEFQHAPAGLPASPIETVFFLCENPSLNGQILNREEPWRN